MESHRGCHGLGTQRGATQRDAMKENAGGSIGRNHRGGAIEKEPWMGCLGIAPQEDICFCGESQLAVTKGEVLIWSPRLGKVLLMFHDSS